MAYYANGAEEFDEQIDSSITTEDCWTVISSFFEEKGLVSQQIDSFDEFVTHTIQQIVTEHGLVILDQNSPFLRR